MKLLLKNGLLKDPQNDIDGIYDILIEKGKIKKIIKKAEKKQDKILEMEKVGQLMSVDLEGMVVLPGLIDLHTHLREPGYEEKETIQTGCEAAAAGGFTKIACMPNTRPVVDNEATVEFIKSKSRDAVVKVYPVGSITKNLAGKNLAEIGFMSRAGVTAISDDGKTVMNNEIMRRAMEYASGFDMTVIDHCEDENLVGDGMMNEGYYSTILGLKPIPAAAEEIIISRDIILSEFTGCKMHIAHLSTAKGLQLVVEAKKRGLQVTAEVTPHHLLLTDKEVMGYNTDTKVNPPLRSQEDRQALVVGLVSGAIDVIATDHAPHTYEDKLGEYDLAANGISGLETALALIFDNFIAREVISWQNLVELMVYNPARILKLDIAGLAKGGMADLTIFDPQKEWVVNPERFKSKGHNTPFAGYQLKGKPVLTIVDGKIVYNDLGGKDEIIY